jgi:hypothetical protein
MEQIYNDPVVWFYLLCSILVSVYYWGKLKIPHLFIYSLSVTALCTFLWELPYPNEFWIGATAIVPYIIYESYFKVKIEPQKHMKIFAFWVVNCLVGLYIARTVPFFYDYVTVRYSVAYMLTYIPRIITMVMLAKVLRPCASV